MYKMPGLAPGWGKERTHPVHLIYYNTDDSTTSSSSPPLYIPAMTKRENINNSSIHKAEISKINKIKHHQYVDMVDMYYEDSGLYNKLYSKVLRLYKILHIPL